MLSDKAMLNAESFYTCIHTKLNNTVHCTNIQYYIGANYVVCSFTRSDKYTEPEHPKKAKFNKHLNYNIPLVQPLGGGEEASPHHSGWDWSWDMHKAVENLGERVGSMTEENM